MILKRGEDSIAFSVRRKKQIAEIDFYLDWELIKQIAVPVDEADEIYYNSLLNGYEEAF